MRPVRSLANSLSKLIARSGSASLSAASCWMMVPRGCNVPCRNLLQASHAPEPSPGMTSTGGTPQAASTASAALPGSIPPFTNDLRTTFFNESQSLDHPVLGRDILLGFLVGNAMKEVRTTFFTVATRAYEMFVLQYIASVLFWNDDARVEKSLWIPAFSGMTDFSGSCTRLDRGNNGSFDLCNNRAEL